MGPIRGLKRRKKAEKGVDHNGSVTSIPTQLQPLEWWDDFSKRLTGSLSQSKDSSNFESIFKISRNTFSYICSLVKEEMMAKPSNFTDLNGKPLCLEDRVAVALRRLSSGESLSAVGDSFGMNQSTVAQITWWFVKAIEERGMHHLQWPLTGTKMKEIKSKFKKIRGLPNCCGAADTTHIKMCLSTVDRSNEVWCDEENNHSMILQAIVDPDMRFLDIFAGLPGSLSDSLGFRSSSFYKLCEEGKRLNGKAKELSNGIKLREYIVGDVGFPLLPWLLTPHQGRNLSDCEDYFNERHNAMVMVAQKALARLKETWKIINGVMWRPDKNKLPRIILVCCLLHNIAIDLNDEVQNEIPFSHDHDLEYRQQMCDCIDKSASEMRMKLSLSLCLEGCHHNMVDQGRNPDNEDILKAAGARKIKLPGVEKLRTARDKKTVSSKGPVVMAEANKDVSGSSKALDSSKAEEMVQKTREEASKKESRRPDIPRLKKKKLVLSSSVATEVDLALSIEGDPNTLTVGPSANDEDKRRQVPLLVDAASSATEDMEPLRRKQKRSASPLIKAEKHKVSEEVLGFGTLGSSMIPFETTAFEGADLKTLMELLFSFHAKGNAVLLRVSDEQKALERRLGEASKECDDAKKDEEKISDQLIAQHDAFHIMKNDYEAAWKEKGDHDKQMNALTKELKIAEEKRDEYAKLAQEATKKVEAEDDRRLMLEKEHQDLETQAQKQKELIEQSEDIIKLQTDQIQNLKDNVEKIIEGWSRKEANWLQGPVASASPGDLTLELRAKVIEEYKASEVFHKDIYDAVMNEFDDGFEFARELIKKKGHDPDALEIIIPKD